MRCGQKRRLLDARRLRFAPHPETPVRTDKTIVNRHLIPDLHTDGMARIVAQDDTAHSESVPIGYV